MRNNSVAFCIDENYIQHLCVALMSLLITNGNVVDNIYVLHNPIKGKTKNIISNFILKKFHKRIIFIEVTETVFEDIFKHFKESRHFSPVIFYRYILPNILPKDLKTILYLDPDIIVVDNIEKIFKIDFNLASEGNQDCKNDCDYYVYAVDHCMDEEALSYLRAIGFILNNDYFNSGILYINLDKWRKENVSQKAIDFTQKYIDFLKWPDQDVLNILFQGKWGKLHPRFNLMSNFFSDNIIDLEIAEGLNKPAIIHFTGSSKPWHLFNKHPYKKIYWKYLWKTPYRFYVPEDIFKIIRHKILNPNLYREWYN